MITVTSKFGMWLLILTCVDFALSLHVGLWKSFCVLAGIWIGAGIQSVFFTEQSKVLGESQ